MLFLINDQQPSFRGAYDARSAAEASPESITTTGAMDSGPALRPAVAGRNTSRTDKRRVNSQMIGFMESLNSHLRQQSSCRSGCVRIYICRAAPDTRMLAPGSAVISARSRDGTPMSSP
jgi:hypothetical protein